MGQPVTYQLLAILDFNNVRKRMSVIGRLLGLIYVYTVYIYKYIVYLIILKNIEA